MLAFLATAAGVTRIARHGGASSLLSVREPRHRCGRLPFVADERTRLAVVLQRIAPDLARR
jgi:hypothetical protein